MSSQAQPTTARVSIRPQTLREAYDPPANVLEVDVVNPETHGVAKNRYTDYEVRLKVIWNILNHLKTKDYSLFPLEKTFEIRQICPYLKQKNQ